MHTRIHAHMHTGMNACTHTLAYEFGIVSGFDGSNAFISLAPPHSKQKQGPVTGEVRGRLAYRDPASSTPLVLGCGGVRVPCFPNSSPFLCKIKPVVSGDLNMFPSKGLVSAGTIAVICSAVRVLGVRDIGRGSQLFGDLSCWRRFLISAS